MERNAQCASLTTTKSRTWPVLSFILLRSTVPTYARPAYGLNYSDTAVAAQPAS